jgi:predicted nucleotidyltransferase
MTSTIEAARDHIAAELRDVFGPLLHSAILKGSAVKGDFIPYYSDLDIHVAGEAFFTEVFDWPRRRGEAAYHRRLAQHGLRAMADIAARWREVQGPLGP